MASPVPDLTQAQITQAVNSLLVAYRNFVDNTLTSALGVAQINRRDALIILQQALIKAARVIQDEPY